MPGFILLSSGNEVYRPDSFTVDPTMPFKFPRFQSYNFNLNDDLLDLPSLQFGDFKEFERKLGFQDVAGDSPVYTLDDIIPFQSYDFNLKDDLLDLPSLQFGDFKEFERKLGFQDVAGDSPVYTLDDIIPIFKEEIIFRAEAMKGEAAYNLFSINGQHFRIKYGIAFSREVEMLLYWTFYSNKMVHQVALAGYLKPKYIDAISMKEKKHSAKGNSDESEIIDYRERDHMIDIRTISGSEIQPHNALYIENFLFFNATLTRLSGSESQLPFKSDESEGFKPAKFLFYIWEIIVGILVILKYMYFKIGFKK